MALRTFEVRQIFGTAVVLSMMLCITTSEAHVTFSDVSELLGGFATAPTNFNGAGNTGINGMVFIDYDNDGDLDLFSCTGSPTSNALFKNDGNGGFTDVTEAAGLVNQAACLGVLAVDLDNDGYLDLVLTADFQATTGSFLYKNNGDGTFMDVSDSSGLPGPGTPGRSDIAAGDYDGDGFVDIFIAGSPPLGFSDILLKNNGDFTFTNVTEAAGITVRPDNSCSATFGDFNGDFLPDILIGQCFIPGPMLLYTNNGDGTFTSSTFGNPGFLMGIAVGDVDHDGDLDLYVGDVGSNALMLPHQFFQNDGNGNFVGVETDVPGSEWGWSNAFVDFDNDKNLDLIIVGSGVAPGFGNFNRGRLAFGDGTGQFSPAGVCGPEDCARCLPLFIPAPLAPTTISFQPDLCYTAGCAVRNLETGEWGEPFGFCNIFAVGCDGCYSTSDCAINLPEQCIPDLGCDLGTSRSSAVAVGDFDGDGFDDIAIMTADYSQDYQALFHSAEPTLLPGAITTVVLLKNNGNSNNYVKTRLVGTTGNKNGIGSVMEVTDPSGTKQYHEVRAVSGPMSPTQYFSSFGLGTEEIAEIVVKWYPSAATEKFCVDANTTVDLVEGNGRNVNADCPQRGNVRSSGNVGSGNTKVGTGPFGLSVGGNNN